MSEKQDPCVLPSVAVAAHEGNEARIFRVTGILKNTRVPRRAVSWACCMAGVSLFRGMLHGRYVIGHARVILLQQKVSQQRFSHKNQQQQPQDHTTDLPLLLTRGYYL